MDQFDQEFLQKDTYNYPEGDLPDDPHNFEDDRGLGDTLAAWKESDPHSYEVYHSAIAYSKLKYYQYGERAMVKATTTFRAVHQLLRSIVGSVPVRTDYRGKRLQYIYQIKEQKLLHSLNDLRTRGERTLHRLLQPESSVSERYSFIGGLLSSGIGSIRVVELSSSNPNGDIRFEMNFKINSLYHELFRQLYPNESTFWSRTDRANTTRLVLAGDDAMDFLTKVASNCPVIIYARPEIDFCFGYASGKVSQQVAFEAYKKFMEQNNIWRG